MQKTYKSNIIFAIGSLWNSLELNLTTCLDHARVSGAPDPLIRRMFESISPGGFLEDERS